jgi:threonine/homoserine/homoserine lactone efflux protein
MLDPSTVALFLVPALALLLFPGPAVLNIVTCSMAHGRRAGLLCVVGTELAAVIHATAAALGLSALLNSSILAFSTVKYLGAAYLICLGVRTLLTREGPQWATTPAPQTSVRLLTQGFLVNLLNPKTALFFLAFLPQFVNPARGGAVVQILTFGALFVTLAFCTDGAYALAAGTAGRWLNGAPRFRRAQRFVTGSVYLGLGLTAALAAPERRL